MKDYQGQERTLRPWPFKTSGLEAVWIKHTTTTCPLLSIHSLTQVRLAWSPSLTVGLLLSTVGSTHGAPLLLPTLLSCRLGRHFPVQIQDSWEPAVPGGGRLVMLSRVTGVGKESVHLEGANGNGLPRSVTC